jgi:hypothetical protein
MTVSPGGQAGQHAAGDCRLWMGSSQLTFGSDHSVGAVEGKVYVLT